MLYSKAPITEVTLEIRHELETDMELSSLEVLQGILGDTYSRENLHFHEFHLRPDDQPAAASNKQTGYRFLSSDNRRIIQARNDGYAFSLMAPYDTWRAFSEEAKALWLHFRALVKPKTITRLGLRYTNRLDFPEPSIELKKYLSTVPEIGIGMPQVLQGYFMQLVLPFDSITGTAIINQALAAPLIPNTTAIMLDIDVYRDSEVPQSEEGVWQSFGQLREGKNEVFNACITDYAKELFK